MKVIKMNFVESVALIFKVFFLSFISITKNGCEISHVWLLINTLKVLITSGYFLFFSSSQNENYMRSCFMVGTATYLLFIYIDLIARKGLIVKTYDLAKSLSIHLQISDENAEINAKTKRKCLKLLIVFQMYSLCYLFYTFNSTYDEPLRLPEIYTFFLIQSFMASFFYVSEFLLMCLKILNKKLDDVLKLETATLMNDKASAYEISSAYEKLQKSVENMMFLYRQIFHLSLKLEEILNLSTLLSLLHFLLRVVMKVRFEIIFCNILIHELVLFIKILNDFLEIYKIFTSHQDLNMILKIMIFSLVETIYSAITIYMFL